MTDLDLIDRKIVAELMQDATLPIAQIADKVGLSQTPCWKRIQKLEAQGVLTRRVALAGALGVTWDRLDTWALYTEDFALLASDDHALAGANAVDVDMLADHRLLTRPYCEHFEQMEAGIGVAIAPRTTTVPKGIHRIALRGLPASRTVNLYAVAGRQRDPAATALMKLLRGADWSRYIH
jgi:DNA-binding Lrp family transcriptional regulator